MPAGAMEWALATVEVGGAAVACIEARGALYRLEPSLARAGLAGQTSIAGLFADWGRAEAALGRAAGMLDETDRLEPSRRLAPLLYPGKILCAGANYFDHLAEMGMPGAKKEEQRLFFFMKPPRNAIVGEGATVHMPIGTEKFDWEIELAAVIGKTARNVSVDQAMQHVAGYTVAIDFSARDHNRAPETFYKLDWVAGKANDTCCPIGPRIVPASAIPDPQNIGLKLSVNGETKQDGRSTDMIFSLAEQIATASRIMTLDPGDLILTGTPAGVGVPKGTFLAVGDSVEAAIEGIGTLSVEIREPR
ncbi:fumarylacetoacetate hydrolase family protein [Bosea sp. TND4EK4]|uniref:fumarylacetoacetate hydrolase family protein n=1 Tax=Bosea sp. TND4EK4 TaxID=1907408 RepID=UPI000956991A|nr:fumarylacetoacetate hydrolase family protein [Bosea sp. TND4EK4]SIQ71371.1 2-keto-4-pentenoate hydratase/2-oxohepta-3-ene-1,7-dioic acid hydratase (catechol pathway) [Bosea sp. TND4EK4]